MASHVEGVLVAAAEKIREERKIGLTTSSISLPSKCPVMPVRCAQATAAFVERELTLLCHGSDIESTTTQTRTYLRETSTKATAGSKARLTLEVRT